MTKAQLKFLTQKMSPTATKMDEGIARGRRENPIMWEREVTGMGAKVAQSYREAADRGEAYLRSLEAK